MSDFPTTHESLLARMGDAGDQYAWAEFVEIYQPIIYRMARKRALQDADAHDVTQSVLSAVSAKMATWEFNENRGRFRSWLTRVCQNAIIDVIRRTRPDRGRGGTSILNWLKDHPEDKGQLYDELMHERRRSMFRWAARQVRAEFEESSWLAFWRTAIDGKAVAETARELGKSEGAVYTARSRVMRRIVERVRQHEGSECPES